MLNRRTGKEKKIKQMHPLPPQSKELSGEYVIPKIKLKLLLKWEKPYNKRILVTTPSSASTISE